MDELKKQLEQLSAFERAKVEARATTDAIQLGALMRCDPEHARQSIENFCASGAPDWYLDMVLNQMKLRKEAYIS